MSRFVDDAQRMYMRWNPTTAMCYKHRMKCSICHNSFICERYGEANKYKIKMIKYAVLKTYANIGTRGIEKYLRAFDLFSEDGYE